MAAPAVRREHLDTTQRTVWGFPDPFDKSTHHESIQGLIEPFGHDRDSFADKAEY
jgi:hypothetical protein